MSKKLLVGTVYAPSPRNNTWLQLQRRYLDSSVGVDDYDLAVWLNRLGPTDFAGVEVVGCSGAENLFEMCREHAYALNRLMEYFLSRPDYDNYMILDSDAFPFRPAWLEKMLVWLREDDRLPERTYASVIRPENLDTFPHPCVVFIKGKWLRSLTDPLSHFHWTVRQHVNLLGYKFEDVGLAGNWGKGYDGPMKGLWQPLLRTNVWNPHPVLAAIYGGLFYHHGAGSRPIDMRAISLRQYDHHIPRYTHTELERALYGEIQLNPELFLRQLAGLQ